MMCRSADSPNYWSSGFGYCLSIIKWEIKPGKSLASLTQECNRGHWAKMNDWRGHSWECFAFAFFSVVFCLKLNFICVWWRARVLIVTFFFFFHTFCLLQLNLKILTASFFCCQIVPEGERTSSNHHCEQPACSVSVARTKDKFTQSQFHFFLLAFHILMTFCHFCFVSVLHVASALYLIFVHLKGHCGKTTALTPALSNRLRRFLSHLRLLKGCLCHRHLLQSPPKWKSKWIPLPNLWKQHRKRNQKLLQRKQSQRESRPKTLWADSSVQRYFHTRCASFELNTITVKPWAPPRRRWIYPETMIIIKWTTWIFARVLLDNEIPIQTDWEETWSWVKADGLVLGTVKTQFWTEDKRKKTFRLETKHLQDTRTSPADFHSDATFWATESWGERNARLSRRDYDVWLRLLFFRLCPKLVASSRDGTKSLAFWRPAVTCVKLRSTWQSEGILQTDEHLFI